MDPYTYSNRRTHPLTGAVSSRPIVEEATISELDFLPGIYGVELLDSVVQGSLQVRINTTGGAQFVEVTGEPLVGQVGIQYSGGLSPRGILVFNPADNGQNILVEYDGAGTVSTDKRIFEMVTDASGSALPALDSRVSSLEQTLFPDESASLTSVLPGPDGWGTTDFRVVRFANSTSQGSVVTPSTTAANGSQVTIAASGLFHIMAAWRYGQRTTAGCVVSRNSTTLSADPHDDAVDGTLLIDIHNTRSNPTQSGATVSGLFELQAGDVLRMHGSGDHGGVASAPNYLDLWRLDVRLIKT